jgi:hypothetical protein
VEGDVYDGDWVQDKVKHDNFQINRHMDMEFIHMLTVQSMKVIGRMIFKMEWEKKLGKMEANMKDITKLE